MARIAEDGDRWLCSVCGGGTGGDRLRGAGEEGDIVSG